MRSMRFATSPRLISTGSINVSIKTYDAPCGCKCPSMRLAALSISERRKSGGGGGVLDRNGETDADEDRLSGGIQYSGDNTDDFAIRREQRTARAARVRGRIELDEIRKQPLSFRRLVFAPQP